MRLAFNEQPHPHHPMITLFQQLSDCGDPINQAPLFLHEPAAGVPPKHLLISQGITDQYTPLASSDALAAAARVPLLGEELRPVQALSLRGLEPVSLPARQNIGTGQGAVTAGMIQVLAAELDQTCASIADCQDLDSYCDAGRCRRDGHFVLFQDTRAQRQYTRFLATFSQQGLPTVAP